MSSPQAAFFTNQPHNIDYVYAGGRREAVAAATGLYPEIVTRENFAAHASRLADVEVIFSTWGFWAFSEEEFAALPKLRAVYYAAGATDAFARGLLARGIALYSAWQANAIPVAEFCTAQIVLAMKGYFRNNRELTEPERFRRTPAFTGPGNYGETVALIGAGAISQRIQEMLKGYRLSTVVIPSRPERRTMPLEDAFRKAFVVSNHLPDRPDNAGVIREEHFRSMRPGAVFINTGRGRQVDEAGMIAALRERPDLTALLDVTWPEPPVEHSPLYSLPNVRLSAHIAGSINDEVIRMADYMLEEFRRVQNGEAPLYRLSEEMLMTH